MGCIITLEHACSSGELEAIRILDERLESSGPETDTRISVGVASLLCCEIPGGLALSLLGKVGEDAICVTMTGSNLFHIVESASDILCKTFKVDDSPF